MSTSREATNIISKIGFEFLDFISYFIPGAVFLFCIALIFEANQLMLESAESLDIYSIAKPALNNLFTGYNYGYLGSLMFLIFSYVLGNSLSLVRDYITEIYSNRRFGYDSAVQSFRNEDKHFTPEKKSLEIRHKCMVQYPRYYSLIHRWFVISMFRANIGLAFFFCFLINAYVCWGKNTQWMWWTSTIFLIMFVILIIDPIGSPFRLSNRIKYAENWDGNSP